MAPVSPFSFFLSFWCELSSGSSSWSYPAFSLPPALISITFCLSSLVIFKSCWSFLLMYQRPHQLYILNRPSSKSLGLWIEQDHVENGSSSSQLLKPETWKLSLMSQLLSPFISNALSSVLSFLPPKCVPHLYTYPPPSISIATILIQATVTFNFWATVIIPTCLPFLAPTDPSTTQQQE